MSGPTTVTALQLAELDRPGAAAIRQLARHAALPAALDPGLLHLLRDAFLLDGPVAQRLPVTAESEAAMARLLLSPLFTQVDDELFEMARPVRAVLLRELAELEGGRRIGEVAALLEGYALEHPSWPAELRWAQRVSARVAADPQAVDDWLAAGARQGGGAGLDGRWFAAMRSRVARERAEPGPDATPTEQPAGGLPVAVETVLLGMLADPPHQRMLVVDNAGDSGLPAIADFVRIQLQSRYPGGGAELSELSWRGFTASELQPQTIIGELCRAFWVEPVEVPDPDASSAVLQRLIDDVLGRAGSAKLPQWLLLEVPSPGSLHPASARLVGQVAGWLASGRHRALRVVLLDPGAEAFRPIPTLARHTVSWASEPGVVLTGAADVPVVTLGGVRAGVAFRNNYTVPSGGLTGGVRARAFRLTGSGLYVTPAHVVVGATDTEWLIAPLTGGPGRGVELLAVDPVRDVAFLRDRSPEPEPGIPLATDPPVAGAPLRAVGDATGTTGLTVVEPAVTERYWDHGGSVPVIRVDRELGPDSSGAVLLDPNDNTMVGMFVAGVPHEPHDHGLAVPAAAVVAAMATVLDPTRFPTAGLTAADARLLARVAHLVDIHDPDANRPQARGWWQITVTAAERTGEVRLAFDGRHRLRSPDTPAPPDPEPVRLPPRLGFDGRHRLRSPDTPAPPDPEPVRLPPRLAELARELEAVTRVPGRTQRVATRLTLLDRLRELLRAPPPDLPELLPALLRSPSSGERLIGVVALELAPGAAWLDTLAALVNPDAELDHIAYQAAVALRSAAEQLPADDLDAVRRALSSAAASLAGFRPSDRASVLEAARQIVDRRRRAAAAGPRRTQTWKLWPNGSLLRVRFLDGSPELHQRVRELAPGWTEGTGLRLAFQGPTATGPADIRVAFTEGAGSWSYLGTDAQAMPADQPTMNIDPGASGSWFDKQVLDEFGHALGLVAEHQQPNADLPWDLDAVHRSFTGPPNHWTREQVDQHILTRYEFPDPPRYREFDPRSIMLHRFDRSLFSGDFETPLNTELSRSDHAFAAVLYPPTGNRS